jgi:hypothetical protein
MVPATGLEPRFTVRKFSQKHHLDRINIGKNSTHHFYAHEAKNGFCEGLLSGFVRKFPPLAPQKVWHWPPVKLSSGPGHARRLLDKTSLPFSDEGISMSLLRCYDLAN